MEKEQAQSILDKRLKNIITSTGRYELRVSTVTPYQKELSYGRSQVAIGNLSAMTLHQAKMAKAAFKAGDYQEAVNQKISFSIRDIDYMPGKGEILDVSIIEVQNKEGIDILVVGSYKGQPVKKPSAMSFEAFLNGGHKEEERVELTTEEMMQVEEEIPTFGQTEKA